MLTNILNTCQNVAAVFEQITLIGKNISSPDLTQSLQLVHQSGIIFTLDGNNIDYLMYQDHTTVMIDIQSKSFKLKIYSDSFTLQCYSYSNKYNMQVEHHINSPSGFHTSLRVFCSV